MKSMMCKCGRRKALKGISKKGTKEYRSSCLTCRREAQRAKKGHCERCLMVPLDKKLLDVDHIDGDRSNNKLNNLQTLCKPCHKIKTKEYGDYKNREKMCIML
jgi:5-methylcytosine-specific restriction endonuclease McrA